MDHPHQEDGGSGPKLRCLHQDDALRLVQVVHSEGFGVPVEGEVFEEPGKMAQTLLKARRSLQKAVQCPNLYAGSASAPKTGNRGETG